MRRFLAGRRRILLSVMLLLAAAWSGLPAPALAQATGSSVIESIQIRGNRRVPTATIRSHITAQAGEAYDPAELQRDFMALYNTGFFQDIALQVDNGKKGKIVTFVVTERPVVRSIEYKGNKSVSQSDILDRFKDRHVELSVDSRYDPTKIKRAEVVLKDLLSERGRQYATVKVETKNIPPSSVALTFDIDEGPKVKVGKLTFQGPHDVPDSVLVRSMHNMRPVGIPYSLIFTDLWSKTYDKNKLDEDLESLRGAFQDRGYYKAQVSDPKVADRVTPGGWFKIPLIYPNKPGRVVDISIPVLEGNRYYLGQMTFKNLTVFKGQEEKLETVFQMKPGDVFDVDHIRKGLKSLTDLYGEYGYITFEANPDPVADDVNHRVNMVFDLDEGKQYTIRRISFSGNTTTRDKVIRRQLLLQEGALFNRRLWELSILRLNQLGYFDKLDPTKDSDIQTNSATGTVDIALKVKEKGKNSIGLSGGVSELTGSFVGFNYTTNNFLGLGETVTLDAQIGSIEQNIMLGLTHPYTFDRPLATGFSIYDRRYNFNESQEASILSGENLSSLYNLLGANNIQDYSQSSYGFTTFASYPLHNNFSRVGLTYGYDISSITSYSTASSDYFEELNFDGVAGPSALTGIRTSQVTPTYTYSTVDSPLNPTRGTSIFTSLEVAGLGGNVKMYRPTVEFKWYHKAGGKRIFAMHLLGSTMDGYGGEVVPPFDRLYVGGEDDIRGFQFFTISPIAYLPNAVAVPILNANGTPRYTTAPNSVGLETATTATITVPVESITFPGGDTRALGNFEYRIPIFGPVSLDFFADIGDDIALYRNQLTLTEQNKEQLTTEFPDIKFPSQLLIAPGTNDQWRLSTGIELRVIMPVVNVPLRVYWAYNPLRLRVNLTPPNLLPPSLFPNQATYNSTVSQYASPQFYEEPANTVRFTIGTTF